MIRTVTFEWIKKTSSKKKITDVLIETLSRDEMRSCSMARCYEKIKGTGRAKWNSSSERKSIIRKYSSYFERNFISGECCITSCELSHFVTRKSLSHRRLPSTVLSDSIKFVRFIISPLSFFTPRFFALRNEYFLFARIGLSGFGWLSLL